MNEIDVVLKKDNFTQVFHQISKASDRFVINYGGTASSKSFSAAQNEVLKAARYNDTKTLVIRKVGATLRDSVIPSFRSRIAEFDLSPVFKFNKTERTLDCINGSQIIFRGLDDPDKLKSFEGLNRILVEEAAELEFEDFLELNRRARGRDNIQITLTFNPVHEEHWLKKHFFDQEMEDKVHCKSTYNDNPFITGKDREQIEWMKRYDHNQYRVYALGEWGLRTNTMPWLFAFNRERHLRPVLPFLPSYPVHLSFDFNREPVSCIAVQMSPHRGAHDSFVHFIKEFAADVQLKELCARIRAAFPASILYVTGDASGNRGDIGFDHRHSTYYQMIRSYLGISERLMHLNPRNLMHHDSRQLINMLFSDYPNILISQAGCPLLANDCIIATVDDESSKPGMLKKDRNMYKMDLFDALRYFFQTYFKDYADKVGVLGRAA
jgi:phage terminase large subunit